MTDPRFNHLGLDPSVQARSALEYLDLWAQLHRGQVHQFGRPSRGPVRGDRPDPIAPSLLRAGIEAYEAQHPQDPIVALARDPQITLADLAILHILLLDVQANPPEEAGMPVVRAAVIACGSDNNTNALERLAPGAPLVTRGLALVTQAERGITYGRVTASSDLVRMAWASNEQLAGSVPALPPAVSADDEGFSIEPSKPASQAVGMRVKPHAGMPFVLPPVAQATFEQVVAALKHGARLRSDFGFAETLPTAAGARVLFYGPPGTGKTTACGALAAALGKEMLVVHPNDILDKYVGSSEKRLAAVFEAAARDNLLLVIDEIDAFAYSRSDASQTHQRQQVTQLLVLLEKHADLPVAATTNEATALDPALERRLTFRIHVQRPGPEERVRLWNQMLPGRLPRAADVDLTRLAAGHEITGAQIRDAIYQAGIHMLDAGRTELTMADLEAGLQVVQGGRWTEATARGPMGFSVR